MGTKEQIANWYDLILYMEKHINTRIKWKRKWAIECSFHIYLYIVPSIRNNSVYPLIQEYCTQT